nr:putative ribonuclease H-like domain-containing protein [Tanacetum cinerariifolium]
MPPKPDLVFHTAPIAVETGHSAFTVQLSPSKPAQDLSHTSRPTAPIIEDWVSDSEDEFETNAPQIILVLFSLLSKGNNKQHASLTHKNPSKHMVPATVLTQSKLVSITAVRPVSVVVPKIMMIRTRLAHPIVTESNSPIRRHITRSQSPKTSNSPPRVTAVQASVVSAAHGNPKGGKISGKGKIKTGKLDFDDVYFVKELKFNLFSVSQMCDKKNNVLFTDTECLVLYPDFKLLDESQVLLRVPRENNMYNVNLKKIVPSGDLTCLFAKATIDESNLWHKRLAHINFKTINKLVKRNLVRGLPTKVFESDNTCVACKKGKQHKASYNTKPVSSVDQLLFRLHMDLFGPTFVMSLNKKIYCLIITDDYSRFTWVFFLATKDETSPILKTFITGLENQLSLKVKVIRSDNGTEFKNSDLNKFCGMKGIKREFMLGIKCKGIPTASYGVPTASEESSHCQKKRDATAQKIALLLKSISNCTTSDGTGKKKGRTVTLTADDMQKRKNGLKARTTLLLSLPDEHQLRFSKYKTAQEIWAAILKTFGGNKATKKMKKYLLKQ